MAYDLRRVVVFFLAVALSLAFVRGRDALALDVFEARLVAFFRARFAGAVFATNCRPLRDTRRFFSSVASACSGDSSSQACFGRYRAVVEPRRARAPSRVVQSSRVHCERCFCAAVRLDDVYPPPSASYRCASSWAFRADH